MERCSAQPVLTGENPGPLVELKFWSARCADLESIVDQVNVHTCTCLSKEVMVREEEYNIIFITCQIAICDISHGPKHKTDISEHRWLDNM